MWTREGYEGVARVLKSYTDEGVSYHAALSRFLGAADLIITRDEERTIGEFYERLVDGHE